MLAVTACGPNGSTTDNPSPGPEWLVTRVYDGDTIAVERGSERRDVRLWGINAPEMGECLHESATSHLEQSVLGTRVGLTPLGDDQFGRMLAQVWNAEGVLINGELVGLGLAIATTPDREAEPALTQGRMLLSEAAAIEDGLGLWAADACGSGPLDEVVIDFDASTVNPPGPDDEDLGGERVAIRNIGDVRVDLSGWVLRDESSRHRFGFPPGTHLDPGEGITIASDDAGWSPGGSPVWNNAGDIVMLLDRHGRVVDHWRYGS